MSKACQKRTTPSQKFSYDNNRRLKMARFDSMYLSRKYVTYGKFESMMKTLYVTVFLAFLFWQCKTDDKPSIDPGQTTPIGVFKFTIPGIEPKNITVADDLIIVHLPENYSKEDYIKPEVIFGTGYSSQSTLLNGFHYKGQDLRLDIQSLKAELLSYYVIVIPHQAVVFQGSVEEKTFTLGPELTISAIYDILGTRTTVDDSGKALDKVFIRFTDQATGKVAAEVYESGSYGHGGNELIVELPPSLLPGEYAAELVWGSQAVTVLRKVTVKPGTVQLKRASWKMLENEPDIEITGFNLPPTARYEAIVQNDFIKPQRIALKYEKPGKLSGMLPQAITSGNYKITYLLDGKEQKPYEARGWVERYSGDDNIYIRKSNTQPILRIVTQPSKRSFFSTPTLTDVDYYPPTKEIDRREPILAYTQADGPTPDHNAMILVNQETGKTYQLTFSGDAYGIFDAFIMLPAYPVPANVPNGRYAIYVERGTEKTERYGDIITLK
ncbi:hypothetical protein [Dyadobacter luticola]|uniref:Uncharacterized protein n=1 Tax=Dyadobacter luticola TaxID=1979387 RepID=A0A5R9KW86_9BACT|nr:hypothetical protein [Dyadobacter luticola]TLV00410.1 hypothetical protein FEN17_13040 [Dyadobacter luticola]